MPELQVGTEVSRGQARLHRQLGQPFPGQAECVPGQAEGAARLQLAGPARQGLTPSDRPAIGPACHSPHGRRSGCRARCRTGRRSPPRRTCACRTARRTVACRRRTRSLQPTLRAFGGDLDVQSPAEALALPADRAHLGGVLEPLAAQVGAQVRRVRLDRLEVGVHPGHVVTEVEAAAEGGAAAAQRVEDRDRSGRLTGVLEARVTLSNNRVNCSLVLPGYFGMVTRSSSNRSGLVTGTGTNRSSSRRKTAKSADSRATASRVRSSRSATSSCRYPTPAIWIGRMVGAAARRAEQDGELGSGQGVGAAGVHAVGRRCEQDHVVGHVADAIVNKVTDDLPLDSDIEVEDGPFSGIPVATGTPVSWRWSGWAVWPGPAPVT